MSISRSPLERVASWSIDRSVRPVRLRRSQSLPNGIENFDKNSAFYEDVKRELTLYRDHPDQERKNTALISAAITSDVKVVKALIEAGADVDCPMTDGTTPLFIAASKGCDAIVNMLIAAGADLDKARETDNATPLFMAALNGHDASVRALLRAGADIRKSRTDGQSPILCASEKGHEAVVDTLLTAGANIEQSRQDGTTPLMIAALEKREGIVNTLLEKGADVDAVNNTGFTPLLAACQGGNEAIVKAILNKNAPVNQSSNSGTAPLLVAALQEHLPIVKTLLKAGALVDRADAKGTTPLFAAVTSGNLPIVKALLEAGALVNRADAKGNTPLSTAASLGHLPIVKALLEAGASVNLSVKGQAPLLHASDKGREAVVKALLEAGADPNIASIVPGYSCLTAASANGHEAVAHLLLDYGARIKTRISDPNDRATPLTEASKTGLNSVVTRILDHPDCDREYLKCYDRKKVDDEDFPLVRWNKSTLTYALTDENPHKEIINKILSKLNPKTIYYEDMFDKPLRVRLTSPKQVKVGLSFKYAEGRVKTVWNLRQIALSINSGQEDPVIFENYTEGFKTKVPVLLEGDGRSQFYFLETLAEWYEGQEFHEDEGENSSDGGVTDPLTRKRLGFLEDLIENGGKDPETLAGKAKILVIAKKKKGE